MTKLSYKITGVLAAVALAATGVSAVAQDTQATQPADATPQTAPTTPATTPDPAAPAVAAPATDPNAPAQNAPAQNAPAMDDVSPATPAPATSTAPTAAAPVADAAPADANAAKNFMKEAFMANEFTIAASQLAATNGESAEVKSAAKTVLDNSLKTREGMIAAIQGSTSDMHFDQAYTADYNEKLGVLKAATGADFDSKYVATQGEVIDHAEGVFKSYAAAGSDESVKTFAANTLPTLDANGDALDQVAQGGQ